MSKYVCLSTCDTLTYGDIVDIDKTVYRTVYVVYKEGEFKMRIWSKGIGARFTPLEEHRNVIINDILNE